VYKNKRGDANTRTWGQQNAQALFSKDGMDNKTWVTNSEITAPAEWTQIYLTKAVQSLKAWCKYQ